MSAPTDHPDTDLAEADAGAESGEEHRSGWRTLGFVGAACVACCAGPILAAVGGIGALGSIAAFTAWPAAGIAVAAVTVAAVLLLRRRRAPTDDEGSVPVELSSRSGAAPGSEHDGRA